MHIPIQIYKALHQQQQLVSDLSYSQVDFSPELKATLKKIRYYYKFIKDITIILDNNSFLTLIKEIAYFYKRNLITDSELEELKAEFYLLIDRFESLLITGKTENETKLSVYISVLNIEANYSYFHYGDKEMIKFWPNAEIPMVIHDSHVSHIEKEWLGTAKKYSMLITQSNEALRSNYILKQRRYLDHLGEYSEQELLLI